MREEGVQLCNQCGYQYQCAKEGVSGQHSTLGALHFPFRCGGLSMQGIWASSLRYMNRSWQDLGMDLDLDLQRIHTNKSNRKYGPTYLDEVGRLDHSGGSEGPAGAWVASNR